MCSVETQCVKTEPLNYIQHWKNETTCNPVMVSLCLWKSYAKKQKQSTFGGVQVKPNFVELQI